MLPPKKLSQKSLGKLKEFTRRQEEDTGEKGNEPVLAHTIHIARVVPAIFRGATKPLRKKQFEMNVVRSQLEHPTESTTTLCSGKILQGISSPNRQPLQWSNSRHGPDSKLLGGEYSDRHEELDQLDLQAHIQQIGNGWLKTPSNKETNL